MIRAIGLSILASAVAAGPGVGQVTPRVSFGATLAGIQSTARSVAGRQVSDGYVVGAIVALRAGHFGLSAQYGEGSVHATGATNDRTLVEGGATATIQLDPWLAVGATVVARRMVETDPERWLAWGATARLEVPIVGRRVLGVAQFRQGLGGEVNLTAAGVRAQDGELGVVLTLPDRPLWVELATRVETYSAGGETRTLGRLGLSVGWRGP